MDPISVLIEIELANIMVAFIGGMFTTLHNQHQQVLHEQRERMHQEHMELRERHHREHISALNGGDD